MRFADESASSYRQGITYAIPPTRLIHVDLDPTEIGKNYPVDVGIVADARAGLAALTGWLRAQGTSRDTERSDYLAHIRKLRDDWLGQVRERAWSEHRPITISRLIAELRTYLDRDAVVVTSSGNTQAQWFQEALVYEPGTNLTTGGFSTMGWTVPAAMGTRLALDDRADSGHTRTGRQVVGLVGDGDFLMTVQELATAVQYRLPVVYLVANNAGWISIRDLQAAVYGPERAAGAEFLRRVEPITPDISSLARAFGCHAQWVSDPVEIRPALEAAFRFGGPAVIEVMVEREYPHSGSPAVGWWDVPVPTYLRELRAQYEREREEEQ
jgi:acetolactate synthase-1/2/3 large subunit